MSIAPISCAHGLQSGNCGPVATPLRNRRTCLKSACRGCEIWQNPDKLRYHRGERLKYSARRNPGGHRFVARPEPGIAVVQLSGSLPLRTRRLPVPLHDRSAHSWSTDQYARVLLRARPEGQRCVAATTSSGSQKGLHRAPVEGPFGSSISVSPRGAPDELRRCRESWGCRTQCGFDTR